MSAEICKECGESVAPGSGKFVNRVSSPDGSFICEECCSKPSPEEVKCPECGAMIDTLEW